MDDSRICKSWNQVIIVCQIGCIIVDVMLYLWLYRWWSCTVVLRSLWHSCRRYDTKRMLQVYECITASLNNPDACFNKDVECSNWWHNWWQSMLGCSVHVPYDSMLHVSIGVLLTIAILERAERKRYWKHVFCHWSFDYTSMCHMQRCHCCKLSKWMLLLVQKCSCDAFVRVILLLGLWKWRCCKVEESKKRVLPTTRKRQEWKRIHDCHFCLASYHDAHHHT